jgi:hypothetical protein
VRFFFFSPSSPEAAAFVLEAVFFAAFVPSDLAGALDAVCEAGALDAVDTGYEVCNAVSLRRDITDI